MIVRGNERMPMQAAGMTSARKRSERPHPGEELYVSAAMVWYEEKAVNLPLLAKRLKGDLHKGRTQEWFQDPGTQRVGFMAM
ncbi:hypothetical protein [Paenibacillus xanthanilyticus]|uniref:Uncharacterized protein n=1 Tax=Paenibacillus xanthanilyticus TaxID=1783531 RepID=A0ABV8K464_9BACL